MKSKSGITKNPLWVRKYWYRKQSKWKYRYRYKYHDGIWGNPLNYMNKHRRG